MLILIFLHLIVITTLWLQWCIIVSSQSLQAPLVRNLKLNWEQCSPLTTPTPTLLRLVLMGNTWNHSSVLALYASIVDRPASTQRARIKDPPRTITHTISNLIGRLMTCKDLVSRLHWSQEFRKHFSTTVPVLPSKPPTAYRSPLSTAAPSVDRRSCMLLTLVQRSIIGS